MAMNGNNMGDEVWNAIKSLLENIQDDHRLSGREGQDFWRLICTKIVEHIQNNAHATGADSRGDSHNLTIT